MAFLGLIGGRKHERTGFSLYTEAVASARAPEFYARLGVPDTLDGRFDLVGLHVFLLIRRLRALPAPGPAVAQAVFDAMFHDMDVNLREMGVSDLSVGKRVRAMWEAFHGRAAVYEEALAAPDGAHAGDVALEQALARNIWRGETPPAGAAASLARIVRAQDRRLATLDLAALTAGAGLFAPGLAA